MTVGSNFLTAGVRAVVTVGCVRCKPAASPPAWSISHRAGCDQILQPLGARRRGSLSLSSFPTSRSGYTPAMECNGEDRTVSASSSPVLNPPPPSGEFEKIVPDALPRRATGMLGAALHPRRRISSMAAGIMRAASGYVPDSRNDDDLPGQSLMVAFPSLWSVIDESTGRIICELTNPMLDPGDAA